ncbi:MAG: 3-phosphoglycerate dehydrogenase, partial [Myxococcales bacterium]
MKVLIADSLPSDCVKDLESLGLKVDYRPDTPVKELPQVVGSASILIVRSKQVAAEVFEAGRALSLVIRAGAGVNTIDVAAASRHGVFVANCPGQNSVAVAELVMGLTIALDRRIPDNVEALRAGRWDKKTFSEARGLYGRTFGIIGLGAIGREVAKRAAGFGMRVVAWSRSLTELKAETLGVDRAETVHQVAAQADVLSLHVPFKPELKHLVNRDVLQALKPGAILINTARAELVDQEALLERVKAGTLRVGLDVYPGEPEGGRAEFHNELAKQPGVYGTHHIGASTAQAQEAIAREAVRIVENFVREGTVPNCVNVARRTPARCQLIVRHHDKVGVLANVLDAVRQAGINAQEIENRVFEGAAAACCKIQLDT